MRKPKKNELTALINHIDRLEAATGGRTIRLDIPLSEQFGAETLAALARVVEDEAVEDDHAS